MPLMVKYRHARVRPQIKVLMLRIGKAPISRVFKTHIDGHMTFSIPRRRRHTSQDNTATYKIPNYADFLIFQVLNPTLLTLFF